MTCWTRRGSTARASSASSGRSSSRHRPRLGHARRVHLPDGLERLHVAAHRAFGRRALHPAGGAGQPGGRARPGRGAHDGRSRGHGAAGVYRLSVSPALLHRGHYGRERQGMTALSLLLALLVQQPQSRTVDTFEGLSGWSAHPADGVDLTIRSDAGYRGRAMRLDFAFRVGGGYAVVHKAVPLELPDDYEFSFYVRGQTPDNNLEFKLIDSTGDNVWWVNRRDFRFPRAWTKVTVKKRHIAFAWGPAGGGELRRVAAIELAISAGTGGGGAGTVWIDELTLALRPPVTADPGPPLARASSAAPAGPPAAALDGDTHTAWRSLPQDAQWLALDFRERREYGGLVLDWDRENFATDYAVQTSDDGRRWETVYTVRSGHGGRRYVALPESESRYLRLLLRHSSRGRGYALADLAVQPLGFAASPNDFFRFVARDAPVGTYPRYFSERQSYWTVVGVSGDSRQALLNEQGVLEVEPRTFSVEPFLWADGALVTGSDVALEQSLSSGDLPIPSVEWRAGDLSLTVTAFATGSPGSATLYATYRVANAGSGPRRVRLYLGVRPFQVNPPWQFLNVAGGVGDVHALAFDGREIQVNGRSAVLALDAPAGFGAATFDEGEVVSDYLRRGVLPRRWAVSDATGRASGALAYDLPVPPGGAREIALAMPLYVPSAPSPRSPRSPRPTRAAVARELAATKASWEAALGRVTVSLPTPAGSTITSTLRTTLAYLLIERDGPALRPGTRSYARAWIRDGALISRALLQLGHAAEVRDFIVWYAGHQYDSGKIPCCIDGRGSDPVPEHDSNGEFIYTVAEYARFTGDTGLARELWPRVTHAVSYLDSLRHVDLTPEYAGTALAPFRGLLPPSISHEGYAAKPMHSYWDDFWALRGLKDAVAAGAMLGETAAAARFAALRDTFRTDLLASLRTTLDRHAIDYLPGSADLGDFDAPSTAIAVAPVDELARLPTDAVHRTFDRYYADFRARRDGTLAWDAYTPYELRVAGTFLRLGEPERARQLLDYFLTDRRPRAWNEWAEVVWRDRDAPRFIGDMPHAWVGAEFVRSVLDLLAYERESDSALVVGAGIAPEWVTTEPGIRVRELGTAYGRLSFSAGGTGDSVRVLIEGTLHVPPGGVIVRSPLGRAPTGVAVNGAPSAATAMGDVTVRALPAEITFRY